jgi:hypothetical protein
MIIVPGILKSQIPKMDATIPNSHDINSRDQPDEIWLTIFNTDTKNIYKFTLYIN